MDRSTELKCCSPFVPLSQKARGRKVRTVRVPGVRKLRHMIERGHPLVAVTQVTRQGTTTSNLLKARTQHAAQDGMMTKLGLLKSEVLRIR